MDMVDVFKKSFLTLFIDPVVFALAVVYSFLYLLFGIYIASIGFSGAGVRSFLTVSESVTLALYLAIVFLVTIFINGMVFIRIGGGKWNLGKAVDRTLHRYFALAATSLLVCAITAAGLVAFVIPGIYLALRLIFAPVSSVLENKSPADAIRRSLALTEGNWWRIFSLFLSLFLAAAVLGIIPYISYFFSFVFVVAYPFAFKSLKGRRM